MNIGELLAAAQVIINETAFTKNTGGRIGSLIKSITMFFDEAKVDKEAGKSLLSTNEIERLANVTNQTLESLNAESTSNKIDDMDLGQESKVKYPSVYAVVRALMNKASLVNGKVPLTQLPGGLGVADESVLPGKISSTMIQQDPDWEDLFLSEGNRIFFDDNHGINRPDGLSEPIDQETIEYNCQSFSNKNGKMSVWVIRVDTDEIYLLQKKTDGSISVRKLSFDDGMNIQSDGSITKAVKCTAEYHQSLIDAGTVSETTVYFIPKSI